MKGWKLLATIEALVIFMGVGGCATTFPWRYYGTKMPDRTITQADVGRSLADTCYAEGTLLGKAGKDGWVDLPLSSCKPDQAKKIKCITQLDDEFYSEKSTLEKCQSDLDLCQKGPKP